MICYLYFGVATAAINAAPMTLRPHLHGYARKGFYDPGQLSISWIYGVGGAAAADDCILTQIMFTVNPKFTNKRTTRWLTNQPS